MRNSCEQSERAFSGLEKEVILTLKYDYSPGFNFEKEVSLEDLLRVTYKHEDQEYVVQHILMNDAAYLILFEKMNLFGKISLVTETRITPCKVDAVNITSIEVTGEIRRVEFVKEILTMLTYFPNHNAHNVIGYYAHLVQILEGTYTDEMPDENDSIDSASVIDSDEFRSLISFDSTGIISCDDEESLEDI